MLTNICIGQVRCDGARPNCSRCHATNKLCAYPPCRRSRNTQPTIADPFIDDLSQLEARIRSIETEQKALRLQLNSFVSNQQVDDKMAKLDHETQDSRSILAQMRLLREQRISKSKREIKRQRVGNNNKRSHREQHQLKQELAAPTMPPLNDDDAGATWDHHLDNWAAAAAAAACAMTDSSGAMFPMSSETMGWSATATTDNAYHPYIIPPEQHDHHHLHQHQQFISMPTAAAAAAAAADIQLPSPLSSPQDGMMYPPQMYASNSTSTVASDTTQEHQQMLDQDSSSSSLFLGMPSSSSVSSSSLAFQYGGGGFDTPCTNDIANGWTVPPF